MAAHYPVININLGGQDCGSGYDLRDLEIISEVFRRAVLAAKMKERGDEYLVAISLSDPKVEFVPETFPVIAEITR